MKDRAELLKCKVIQGLSRRDSITKNSEHGNSERGEKRKRDEKKSEKETEKIPVINLNEEISSPESKKIRNEDNRHPKFRIDAEPENMETIDVINKDLAIVYNTRVLSKLEIDTDDKKIEKLINCYNPIICGDYDLMKKHMFDLSEDWSNRVDTFKAAIKFVVNDENESESLNSNIEELAEILLSAIENRMPKYCADCKVWYVVARNNKPELHCSWCAVGIHDCKKLKETKDIHGIAWFCVKCNELFTSQIQPKMRKLRNIMFEGFTDNDKQEKEIKKFVNEMDVENKKEEKSKENGNESNIRENKSTRPPNEGDANRNEINPMDSSNDDENRSANNDNNENRTVRRNASNQRINNNNNNNNSNNNNSNNSRNEDGNICWFYVNRKCKFGRDCKKVHPKECQQWLEFGLCDRGNNCELVHPQLCKNLLSRKGCTRNNCWFVHPSEITTSKQERRMPHRPLGYRQNDNNLRSNLYNNYPRPGQSSNDTDFLENWPTPAETIQQQTMKRLIGIIERMDARVEKMESQQMNRWPRYNP